MGYRASAVVVITLCMRCMLLGAPTASADPPEPNAAFDWVTVNGKVVSVAPDSFSLDCGKGLIFVDVTGAKWYERLRPLLRSHQLTVYGALDRDAKRGVTLRATSVYDRSLGTFFRPAQSGKAADVWAHAEAPGPGYVEVTGEVATIRGREITLTSGVSVDTNELSDNPLDELGYPRVHTGDRIKAGGSLRADLGERTELMAGWIAKFCVETCLE